VVDMCEPWSMLPALPTADSDLKCQAPKHVKHTVSWISFFFTL